jgi:class 3 adenylate cyclase
LPENEELEDLVASLQQRVKETKGRRATKVVAMFDLASSTSMKLLEGHNIGTKTALLHNLICREIVNTYGGSVIKELGDGVLVSFDDCLNACLAAIDIKTAIHKHNKFLTKGGMTIGEVEELEIAGIRDLLGASVDRCARIASTAVAGQILMDSALYDGVSSFLKDHQNIIVGPPDIVYLRDIGLTITRDITTKEIGFIVGRRMPFILQEEGRLLINQKVAFMQNAKQEIIELGVGLTTFTKYFTSIRRSEFRDHVVKLLESGVDLKCMLLDPDSRIAEEYTQDLKEPDLTKKIRLSIRELKKQQKEFEGLKLTGAFGIYGYRKFPYFHAVCTDPEADVGRMTVSHYLHGVRRAETPVFQFCKAVNKNMFEKYWASIKELLVESRQL